MITELGIVAGEIWHLLDQKEELSLSQIMGGINRSQDVVLMSLGWLAREGHVVLRKEDEDYRVSLR